jgi:hypothetical protein
MSESDQFQQYAEGALLWVAQSKTEAEKRPLIGPEKSVSVEESSVSPDLSYIAIERWKPRSGSRGNYTAIELRRRDSGAVMIADLPNHDLSLVGWENQGDQLRALLVTNRWGFDREKQQKMYVADPATGQLTEDNRRYSDRESVSPDGMHRMIVDGKERLLVTDLGSGQHREFQFHEDDRRYVEVGEIKWVSSRYIEFQARRLGLIDVSSLKMNYPTNSDCTENQSSYSFSPDFHWVLYEKRGGANGLFLGKVVLPTQDTE